MNLETLKLFRDIVRLQSFSKGAQANAVTQSAASQAIQQLEEELGQQLIDRSKRPFALTAKGQVYFDGLRQILEKYAELEEAVKKPSGALGGSLRVAAIYSVGLYDLTRLMGRFMAQNTQVKVRLEYLRPNKVHDAVVGGDAELGILSYPKADRTVTIVPWRSEKMVFVCQPGHRLSGRSSVRMQDLDGESFIAYDADLPIRKAIDRALKQHDARVNTVMEFDNIETMKQAVEVGAGVAILPEPTVRRSADGRRMVAVPIELSDLVRPVGIIHRRNRPLTPAAQQFIKLLKSEFER